MDEASTLNGDNPCDDCGTPDNIIWFTDNTLWNAVCTEDNPKLCIRCFVKRFEQIGYSTVSWRVLPAWDWTRR